MYSEFERALNWSLMIPRNASPSGSYVFPVREHLEWHQVYTAREAIACQHHGQEIIGPLWQYGTEGFQRLLV